MNEYLNEMLNIHTYKKNSNSYTDTIIQSAIENVLTSKSIGFIDLPNRTELWNQSENLGTKLRNNYDHLIVVGIGGSSMGPRSIVEFSGKTNISFLDNVDSIETESVLRKIQSQEKIAWLFISKSGNTIEVLWTIELIHQRHTELNKSLWPDTYYISELTDNSLHNLSIQHQRPCLEIPLDVGGRFSVLSPVGLVIASYLGLNLEQIKCGTVLALKDTQNLNTLCNQFLASFERSESITLFWFYCSRLRWFGGWVQQLWAESLGKKMNREGQPAFPFSTPISAIGACDQHSILQQVIDGPKNKFVCLFRFKEIENKDLPIHQPIFKETLGMKNKKFGDLIKAEALATQRGLELSDVSTMMYEFEHFNSETLGYLFMSFQIVVAVLAEIKNINAFDQPGVQLGKKLIPEFI